MPLSRLILVDRFFVSRIITGGTPLASKEFIMLTAAFYSVNEAKKAPAHRVYHNNTACPPGRDIPHHERRAGTGGYRLCHDCQARD